MFEHVDRKQFVDPPVPKWEVVPRGSQVEIERGRYHVYMDISGLRPAS